MRRRRTRKEEEKGMGVQQGLCGWGREERKEKKEKKEWDKIRDTWRDVSGWGDFLLFKTPYYY
jgi:hypothetical protein